MVDISKALRKALNTDQVGPPRPGETDVEFVARKFDGKIFPCGNCGKEIQWIGACETCEKEFNTSTMSDFDRIMAVGVPREIAKSTWKTFKMPRKGSKQDGLIEEINQLKQWRGVPHFVIISGRPGTGKTHMAVATMWRRLRSKGPFKMCFLQEREFLDRLKKEYGTDENDYAERILRIQFLVLDDFGHSRMTEWAVDTVAGLLCRRFDEGKVTVITTNLVHRDMHELDPRLGSRVHEALAVGTSSMPDFRAKKGKP